MIAGLRYLKGRRVLQSTFTIDIVAMVFGMPRVLFPVLAVDAVPPRSGGGRLACSRAAAFGALVGALTLGLGRRGCAARASRSSSRSRCGARRSPRSGWWATNLWLALGVPRGRGRRRRRSPRCSATTIQQTDRSRRSARTARGVQHLRRRGWTAPRRLRRRRGRGRCSRPQVSVVSGGLLCLAGVGVIAAAVPRFARWRVGEP